MKEDHILNFFREERQNFISGEEISKKLKVSRSAVWKEIQALRKLGYEIEAQPHLGYRLTAIPDKLFADEIAYKLGTKIVGKRIFSYDSIDSTNDAAYHLGAQGIEEGACVFAEHQKKGRGRMGRNWASPKGKNILLSVLLRPVLSPADVSKITLVAGVSVVKAISELTGKKVGLKWPNDILYKNKKLCGILTEMNAESDRVNFVVVGIGININSEPAELLPNATSIYKMTGEKISRVEFARTLLKQLEHDYLRLKKGDFESLSKDWEQHSVTTGQRVSADILGRKIQGLAMGIDSEGALWVRQDNGIQQRIAAGDVHHLESLKK